MDEWQALYLLEPWGEERADLRMGILAATIANGLRWLGETLIAVHGGHPRRHDPYLPGDFLPRFDAPPPEPPRPENVHAFFTMLSHAGIGYLIIEE